MSTFVKALQSGHWPSLFGGWLHFEVSFMVWLLIGALGVSLAEAFELTPTQKGVVVSIPLLAGALLRVVVGPLSDIMGAKRMGVALLALEAIGLVSAGMWVDSFGKLLVVGSILGFAGASFAVALPLASQSYPPGYQGLAMGIAASGNSGGMLAAYFAPRWAEAAGWQGAFLITVIPVLVTFLLFLTLVRADRERVPPRQTEPWTGTLLWGLRQPLVYWLCFFYAVTFGGFVGLLSFLPIFLHDQYGMDMVTAGAVTALGGLLGSVARPFGGYMADQRGGFWLLQGLFPILAFLAIVAGQLPPAAWGIPVIIATVGLLGFGNGVVFQVVSLRFRGIMGTASGLIGAAGGVGGFLLPTSFGLSMDLGGTYAAGFILLALVSAGAAGSLPLVQQMHRRTPDSS